MTKCYLCGNPATVRVNYARSEAAMCNDCDDFVGDNFTGLFRLHIDSRECNALRILRNAPKGTEVSVLKKLETIINLPGHKVLRELEEKIRKVQGSCESCPPDSTWMSYYHFRVIEEKKGGTYEVICKHMARELDTHTPCNVCGVRFLNDNDIIKKARKAENSWEPTLKCLLCQQESQLLSDICGNE